EFETEKKVVLEEIAMAKDNLEHVAFDFIQEKVFADHPLAWPVLGYEETVESLSRDQMWEYFQRRYAPDNMVIIVAGKVDPQEIIGLAEELCGSWPASGATTPRTQPTIHGGVDVLQLDRFKQQIVCLTFPSVSAADDLAETASAAATILGGDNSRFFWKIVQAGICPRAGAHHLEYTDTGAIMLFGACNPDKAEKLVDAMRREAKLICTGRVQDFEVDRVKNRRRTTLAVESEAPYHRLTQLIDDMEYRGEPRTVDQMLAEVDAVAADTIQEYFERYPIDGGGHFASTGPRLWPDTG
ncbi:MAG: M16 family metallopeptidase, partial [Phycisphaerae bacterium]